MPTASASSATTRRRRNGTGSRPSGATARRCSPSPCSSSAAAAAPAIATRRQSLLAAAAKLGHAAAAYDLAPAVHRGPAVPAGFRARGRTVPQRRPGRQPGGPIRARDPVQGRPRRRQGCHRGGAAARRGLPGRQHRRAESNTPSRCSTATGVAKDEAAGGRRCCAKAATQAATRSRKTASPIFWRSAAACRPIRWRRSSGTSIAKAGGVGDIPLDKFMQKQTPETRAAAEKAAQPWLDALDHRRIALLTRAARGGQTPAFITGRPAPAGIQASHATRSSAQPDRPPARTMTSLRQLRPHAPLRPPQRDDQGRAQGRPQPQARFRRGRAPAGLAQGAGQFRHRRRPHAPRRSCARNSTRRAPATASSARKAACGEGTDKTHRWIVDPLDGTMNFLHGIPHFAISIALEREGTIVAGLVYNPAPTSCSPPSAARAPSSTISGCGWRRAGGSADAVVACGLPAPQPRRSRAARARSTPRCRNKVAGLRRFGAAALDLAWVAAGRFDAYWERGLSPWDMAAGIVAGARSRRLRHRSRRPRRHASRPATSSPATRTSTASCCAR